MAKKTIDVVHCRYPKCSKLHESTELNRVDAVKGGSKNTYYHPDCYHVMQTVCKIRDTFVKYVNPNLTGAQIGQLVSIVNNLIFGKKKVDVDYILFAIQYFIKHKPGALKFPGGITYIIQNREVEDAWKKEQDRKIRAEIKAEMDNVLQSDTPETIDLSLNFPEHGYYKPQNKSKFSNVLGV